MVAGIRGRGAEGGWYSAALNPEEVEDEAMHTTIGTADVFKCFDQLIRGTIYQLVALSGMPARILTAYRRFQEGLIVQSAIAGGLGCPSQTH